MTTSCNALLTQWTNQDPLHPFRRGGRDGRCPARRDSIPPGPYTMWGSAAGRMERASGTALARWPDDAGLSARDRVRAGAPKRPSTSPYPRRRSPTPCPNGRLADVNVGNTVPDPPQGQVTPAPLRSPPGCPSQFPSPGPRGRIQSPEPSDQRSVHPVFPGGPPSRLRACSARGPPDKSLFVMRNRSRRLR